MSFEKFKFAEMEKDVFGSSSSAAPLVKPHHDDRAPVRHVRFADDSQLVEEAQYQQAYLPTSEQVILQPPPTNTFASFSSSIRRNTVGLDLNAENFSPDSAETLTLPSQPSAQGGGSIPLYWTSAEKPAFEHQDSFDTKDAGSARVIAVKGLTQSQVPTTSGIGDSGFVFESCETTIAEGSQLDHSAAACTPARPVDPRFAANGRTRPVQSSESAAVDAPQRTAKVTKLVASTTRISTPRDVAPSAAAAATRRAPGGKTAAFEGSEQGLSNPAQTSAICGVVTKSRHTKEVTELAAESTPSAEVTPPVVNVNVDSCDTVATRYETRKSPAENSRQQATAVATALIAHSRVISSPATTDMRIPPVEVTAEIFASQPTTHCTIFSPLLTSGAVDDGTEATPERPIELGHSSSQATKTIAGENAHRGTAHANFSASEDTDPDHNSCLALVLYTGNREIVTTVANTDFNGKLSRVQRTPSETGRTTSSSPSDRQLVKMPTSTGYNHQVIDSAANSRAITTLVKGRCGSDMGYNESQRLERTTRMTPHTPQLLTSEETCSNTTSPAITTTSSTHFRSALENSTEDAGNSGNSRGLRHPPLRNGPEDSTFPRMDRGRPPSEWIVMSAKEVKQAANKLQIETRKNKTLESTVRKHKRERVIIYDAAMKQAAKREDEAISEARQSLRKEHDTMRAEVDTEVQKMNDLYQERCRDYALMVSDECEGEVSRKVADLRKDWAQQKKTIADLVRHGDGEDRQVTVIARAIMEQLAEERKEGLENVRSEIHGNIRAEFEAREVAMKDALQSEHQSDLEGQMLLTEIEHQREIDQLRAEIGAGSAVADSSEYSAPAGRMVVYQSGGDKLQDAATSGTTDDVFTPSSSLPRRAGVTAREASDPGRPISDAAGRATLGGGRRGLGNKLPVFKTPVPKISFGVEGKRMKQHKRKASTTASSPTDKQKPATQRRARIKQPITVADRNERPGDVLDSTTNAKSPTSKEDPPSDALEEGITSALMVSPIKAFAETATTTPSVASTAEEPSRPKKRGKKLFSPRDKQ